MIKLYVKPLSVNKAWKGRRYKSNEYKLYELLVNSKLSKLPNIKIPKGNLILILIFGFSTKSADFDNPVKPFTDILQKKYGFNDARIYVGVSYKKIVKKGDEYVEFKILAYNISSFFFIFKMFLEKFKN